MFSTMITKTFKTVRLAAALALIFTASGGMARANGGYGGGGGGGVPELDPGSLASAATLLTGGVLMLSDKLRRK